MFVYNPTTTSYENANADDNGYGYGYGDEPSSASEAKTTTSKTTSSTKATTKATTKTTTKVTTKATTEKKSSSSTKSTTSIKTTTEQTTTSSKPTAENKPYTSSKSAISSKSTTVKATVVEISSKAISSSSSKSVVSDKSESSDKPTGYKPATTKQATSSSVAKTTDKSTISTKDIITNKDITSKVVSSDKPTTSPKPETSIKPATSKPTTSSKPVTDESVESSKPVTSKTTTSAKPETSKPATEKAVESSKSTTTKSTTISKIAATDKPVTSSKTTTSTKLITSDKPATTKSVESSKPVTSSKPTTSGKSVTDKAIESSKATTSKSTTSTKPETSKPVTNKTTTTSKPQTSSESVTTKPTTTTSGKPTTTTSGKSTTTTSGKPTTSDKPVTNKSVESSKPATGKPTTSAKPATSDKPTTSKSTESGKPTTSKSGSGDKAVTDKSVESSKSATGGSGTSSKPTTSGKDAATSKTTTAGSKSTTTSASKSTSSKASSTTHKSSAPTGYAVTGAEGGAVCVERQNINELQSKYPKTFNLLVLALAQIQAANTSDPLSFYQLSGIHGAPYIAWPNPKETGNFDATRGYCTHRSVLFATWHRPYMLMFEQTLYYAAKDIATEFTGSDKQDWIDAAKLVRWPYWDWACSSTQSHVPLVATTPKIDVIKPGSSSTVSIDNPFFSYSFKKDEQATFGEPMRSWHCTLRSPDKAGLSRMPYTDESMQSGYGTRRKQAYNALMSEDGYNAFCNALENIHNDIHVRVGGGGSMSYIPYAAFDPLFWLHHNNIDRLAAIWQAANPGKLLEPDVAVGTFQRRISGDPDDSQDNLNTPLYPFKHPDGSWWTSRDSADVNGMWAHGYGYPEVPCNMKGKSSTELDDFTTAKINTEYQDKNQTTQAPKRLRRRADAKTLEWDINVVVDPAELPGTASIVFFFGAIPSDPATWLIAPNQVGAFSLFGAVSQPGLSTTVGGTIPLTPALVKAGIKGNETVESWLGSNLKWGVTTPEGESIDITKLKTLTVGVASTAVQPAVGKAEKPTFEKPKLRTKATQKVPGGIGKTRTANDLKNPKKKNGKEAKHKKGLAKVAKAVQ
ncbi:Tyrosinase [Dactylellina cionopaga]|nr:Tyrosinase [Dactylellina cionopaga]